MNHGITLATPHEATTVTNPWQDGNRRIRLGYNGSAVEINVERRLIVLEAYVHLPGPLGNQIVTREAHMVALNTGDHWYSPDTRNPSNIDHTARLQLAVPDVKVCRIQFVQAFAPKTEPAFAFGRAYVFSAGDLIELSLGIHEITTSCANVRSGVSLCSCLLPELASIICQYSGDAIIVDMPDLIHFDPKTSPADDQSLAKTLDSSIPCPKLDNLKVVCRDQTHTMLVDATSWCIVFYQMFFQENNLEQQTTIIIRLDGSRWQSTIIGRPVRHLILHFDIPNFDYHPLTVIDCLSVTDHLFPFMGAEGLLRCLQAIECLMHEFRQSTGRVCKLRLLEHTSFSSTLRTTNQ